MERIGVSALGVPESSHTQLHQSQVFPWGDTRKQLTTTAHQMLVIDRGVLLLHQRFNKACGFDVKLCGGGLTSGTQTRSSIISKYVQNLTLA